jgi:hypothetical protein
MDVHAALHAVWIEVGLVAIGVLAAVQAIVEIAENPSGEGDCVALEAVGFDVAAEVDLHGCSLGAPRGGGAAKWFVFLYGLVNIRKWVGCGRRIRKQAG